MFLSGLSIEMAHNVWLAVSGGALKHSTVPHDQTKLRKQNYNATLHPAIAASFCWALAFYSISTQSLILL
jgi:hypothetical protein